MPPSKSARSATRERGLLLLLAGLFLLEKWVCSWWFIGGTSTLQDLQFGFGAYVQSLLAHGNFAACVGARCNHASRMPVIKHASMISYEEGFILEPLLVWMACVVISAQLLGSRAPAEAAPWIAMALLISLFVFMTKSSMVLVLALSFALGLGGLGALVVEGRSMRGVAPVALALLACVAVVGFWGLRQQREVGRFSITLWLVFGRAMELLLAYRLWHELRARDPIRAWRAGAMLAALAAYSAPYVVGFNYERHITPFLLLVLMCVAMLQLRPSPPEPG